MNLPDMQSRAWVSTARQWLSQTTGKVAEKWLVGDVWYLVAEGYLEDRYMMVDVRPDAMTLEVEYDS